MTRSYETMKNSKPPVLQDEDSHQVFVVFANRAGRDYYGGSMVLDPHGDVVALAGEKKEILRAELDFASLERWRKEEAIFSQRRPKLYRLISD